MCSKNSIYYFKTNTNKEKWAKQMHITYRQYYQDEKNVHINYAILGALDSPI